MKSTAPAFTVSGHDDHRQGDAPRFQGRLDFEAVHSGHPDVEKDAAGFELGVQELRATVERAHLKSRRL